MEEAIYERDIEHAFGADFHGLFVVLADDSKPQLGGAPCWVASWASQRFGTRDSIRVATLFRTRTLGPREQPAAEKFNAQVLLNTPFSTIRRNREGRLILQLSTGGMIRYIGKAALIVFSFVLLVLVVSAILAIVLRVD